MADRERNGVTATVGKSRLKRQGQSNEFGGTPREKFGQRLGELMAKADLSREEFAEKIGVGPDMVRKYLRGFSIPDINRWPDMARALGLKNCRELIPDIPV